MKLVALSPAQQRLWLLDTLDGPSPTYTMPVALRLTGALDVPALASAVTDLVACHESLRTVFREQDGTGYQQVLDVTDAGVALTVQRCAAGDVAALVEELADHAFDLAAGVPFLARLLVVSPADHVLVLLMHHVICDGLSLRPLLGDLAEAYRARAAGTAPNLPDPPIRYTDFALWQRDLLGAEDDPTSLLNRQLAFWADTLAGTPEELELPTDRPRPAVASNRGSRLHFRLPASVVAGLRETARAAGATLFMALDAAVAALLSRLGAGPDIPLGTATAGRTEDGLDDIVGFFVNTVVIRNDLSGDPTFHELLRRVRVASLRAFDHQDVPFDRVVEHVNPPRSRSRNPLYQVTVELHGAEADQLPFPGLSCQPYDFPVSTAKSDLSWDFTEADGGTALAVELSYAEDLFDRATAADLAAWFARFVEGLVAAPGLPVSTVPLVDEREWRRLLDVEARPAHADVTVGVVERVQRRAHRHPDAIAVVDGTGSTTYGVLVGRASRTARRLAALRLRRGEVVPVLLERGAAVVVAFLGINTAGCAYLPLDTEAPAARTTGLLDDLGARCLVTDPAHAEQARRLVGQCGQAIEVLVLDEEADELNDLLTDRCGPEDAAYVIFTSGSTGRPKGAVVKRRGMVNNLLCEVEAMSITGPELIALTAPLTFDISVWQMFVALIFGGAVRAVPTPVTRDPRALFDLVAAEGVTVLQVVPSLLQAALDDWDAVGSGVDGLRLRVLAVTGEALPAVSCRRWLARHPSVPLVNCYGPTECSDDVTHAVITADTLPVTSRTPIGRPVRGSRLYVLDERLLPVPDTIAGELYVGGLVVGGGYLRDPARTAATFVADPYAHESGARMYRTGDIVRRRRDGQFEFLGRRDHQVKIRGQRIELGEIEHTMRGLDGVRDVVVTAVTEPTGTLRLVGYFTGDSSPEKLREALVARLAPAMVPSAFVRMAAFPLTPNGKLDRTALPEPQFAARPTTRPPRNQVERVIRDVFREVLGVAHVGVEDRFFDLGGHSLLALRVVRRIEERLHRELRVGALFDHPSVAELAAHVEATRHERTSARDEGLRMLLPLRATGDRPPLFCVHPAAGTGWMYAGLLPHLDPNQPLYALQARGLTTSEQPTMDLSAMVAEYLAQIRAVQPGGPYHLAGWSFGGVVAHAMAAALAVDGAEVSFLAVFDGYPFQPGEAPPPTDADAPDSLAALLVSVGFAPERLPAGGVTRAEYERLARGADSPLAALGERGIAALPSVFAANALARRRVDVGMHRGDLLLFVAGSDPDDPDPARWSAAVTDAVEVHVVACRHGDMMRAAALTHIGPVLAERLRRAQAAVSAARTT
ncbi:amino acid adenylation domain-containing protein [Micromonospora sp. NPDC049275]|uniref:non-ribosomal peptide synthetase n=1 Tax=Micromonospora sp. NPDC049275 TaxID=3364268 RepID=UPI003711B875